MTSPDLLIILYTKSYEVVAQRTATLSHQESLTTFFPAHSSINWYMGHIAVARWNLLTTLGSRASIWDFAEARRYIPGAALDPTDAIPFDKLRSVYAHAHAEMIHLLSSIMPDALDQPVANGVLVGRTLGEELLFYQSHEAYHAGQIELCCQLLGMAGEQDYR